jgi:hypothetical protein
MITGQNLDLSNDYRVWYNLRRATVAQLAEQPLRKRRVMGSTPFGGSCIDDPCYSFLTASWL